MWCAWRVLPGSSGTAGGCVGRRRNWGSAGEPLFGEGWQLHGPDQSKAGKPAWSGPRRGGGRGGKAAAGQAMLPWFEEDAPGGEGSGPVRADGAQPLAEMIVPEPELGTEEALGQGEDGWAVTGPAARMILPPPGTSAGFGRISEPFSCWGSCSGSGVLPRSPGSGFWRGGRGGERSRLSSTTAGATGSGRGSSSGRCFLLLGWRPPAGTP